jgi:hypothetical protein
MFCVWGDYAKGICISNWGTTSMRTLQRNGVLYDLMYGAILVWEKYAEDTYPEINAEVFQRMYKYLTPQADKILTVTHTVQTPIQFKYFFDGYQLDEEKYFLGYHVFRSAENGTFYRFPVIFGKNISNAVNAPARLCDPLSDFDRYIINRQYMEILGGADPVCDKTGKMWYKATYPHPCPGRNLVYKEFRPGGKHKCRVLFKEG